MGRSIALGTAEAEAQKSRKKCEGGGREKRGSFLPFLRGGGSGEQGREFDKKRELRRILVSFTKRDISIKSLFFLPFLGLIGKFHSRKKEE